VIPKVILVPEGEVTFIAGEMPFNSLVGQQLVNVRILHVAFGADERLDRFFYVGVIAPRAEHVGTHDAAQRKRRSVGLMLES
jgi:hypothetical protein